jgi:hypothetical protein
LRNCQVFEISYRCRLRDEVGATVVLKDGALHDRVIHDEGRLWEDLKETGGENKRKRRGKSGRSTSDKRVIGLKTPESSLNFQHARKKR